MSRIVKLRTLLCYLLVIIIGSCFAAIQLQHQVIDTERDNLLGGMLSSKTSARGLSGKSEDRQTQLLFELSNHASLKDVEQLLGKKASQFIPPHTYVFLDVPSSVATKLQSVSDKVDKMIHWVGHMKPQYKTKLDFSGLKTKSRRSLVPDDQKVIGLDVTLIANSKEEASMVTNRIRIRVAKYGVTLKLISNNRLFVRVSATNANSVLNVLKYQEEVHWIERKLPMKLMNFAASIITQGNGTVDETDVSRPIWDMGITGHGEIVGVADTGLDYDSCFFSDPEESITVNEVNTKHRKVVGYFTNSETDDRDEVSGHGTHVCGTIAGNAGGADSVISDHNGLAPDAKLFFQDISATGSEGLQIPDNLYDDLLLVAYETGGARIHSNSWGCSNPFTCTFDCQCTDSNGNAISNEECRSQFGQDCCRVCNSYESSSREMDRFLSDHEDMLIVIAAGNSGRTATDGTISSPATAKNVLSVGASNSFNSNFIKSIDYKDFSAYMESKGYTSVEQCCELGDINCCPEELKKYYEQNFNAFNQHNMADFSSRGPTADGRNKPDLVAPGNTVISAHSDGDLNTNQCGTASPLGNNNAALLTMQGTSMATPAVSGSAALVRQYYKDMGINSNPSGPLVKATLIHSAAPLTGVVYLDGVREIQILPTETPNKFYGYGLVSLSNVLRSNNSNYELFAFDNSILDDSEWDNYYFTTTDDNAALKATLCWYDPPSAPSAADLLVNDIDLRVFYYPSGSDISDAIIAYGNGVEAGDSVNTVEQATVSSVASSYTVVVSVNAKRVQSRQKYSLVVTSTNIQDQFDQNNHEKLL
jgi:subtilisin family serine protease